MFVVQVAADLFGAKTNFELSFGTRPTILELTRATEAAFTNEIALRRPDHVPAHAFHVAKFKYYDEDRSKWVELVSEATLVDYTQVYAFQPENAFHRETQKEIPAAVKPPTAQTVARANAGRAQAAGSLGAGAAVTAVPSSAAAYGGGGIVARISGTSSGGYIAGGGGSAGVNRFVGGGGGGNVDATDDEKVRTVFAEFDLKNNRMIDIEDLKQGFRTLGIDFTTATLNDLFSKGDYNSDGRISLGEFERFAKYYPIMIDCLFYRSKAFWDDQNIQRELEAEAEAVRQAAALAAQAEAQLIKARSSAEESQAQIAAAESDIKDKASRLREVSKETDIATREKDRAQKERYDREGDAVAHRDKERQARQVATELQRELEKTDRRHGALAADAQRADERLRALQQQLQEAQRAAERASQAAKQSQIELDSGKNRLFDAAKVADALGRELPRFEDALRQAEGNVAIATDRIRELEILARDLSRESEEAQRRRETSERQAALAKEHEAAMAAEVLAARRSAEERERAARQREAELLELQRQRQMVTADEKRLIDQELRLREQRESLEEKEGRLRTEALSHLSQVRQAQRTGSVASGLHRDGSALSAYGRNESAATGGVGGAYRY